MRIKGIVRMEPDAKCVYSHSIDGSIFYIGSGSISRAFNDTNRNETWKSMVEAYKRYDVEILFESQNPTEVLEFEKKKILELKPLANLFVPKV